jgi:hypothetical protein
MAKVDPGSENVFRTSPLRRFLTTLLSAAMIGLFSFTFQSLLSSSRSAGSNVNIVLLLMCFGMGSFFLYLLLSVYKTQLVILADRIQYSNAFAAREIMLDDIAGFRLQQARNGGTLIVSSRSSDKKIAIQMIFEDNERLIQWVTSKFTNLDEVAYKREMTSLVHDEKLGMTEEQRIASLNRAKKWIKIINIASGGAAAWALFKPYPFEAAIAAQGCILCVAALSFRMFPGLVKFGSNYKRSLYPDVAPAFMLPVLALIMRAISWHVLSWSNFWTPFAALSLALAFFLFIVTPEIFKDRRSLILGLILCIAFGYGACVNLNGIIKSPVDHAYTTWIIGKHISTGKSTTYYFQVYPWEDGNERKSIRVARDLYDNKDTGDSVKVVVMAGGLKIPWYFLK